MKNINNNKLNQCEETFFNSKILVFVFFLLGYVISNYFNKRHEENNKIRDNIRKNSLKDDETIKNIDHKIDYNMSKNDIEDKNTFWNTENEEIVCQ